MSMKHVGIACFTVVLLGVASCRDNEPATTGEHSVTDSESFQAKLYKAAVREGAESFEALVTEYPHERFFAFTLYTNNDLRGVYPFANTIEGLERSGLDFNSEEKWIAGEWRLQTDDVLPRNPMVETTALLIEASDAYSDDPDAAKAKFGPHSQFRIDIFRTLSEALFAIRESGIFRGHAAHDRIAFWVHVGDPDGTDNELMFRFVMDHLEPGDADQLREVYGFD